MLMKSGFLPGHAFYYQMGFPLTEMTQILAALEFVNVDTRNSELRASN